MKNIILKHYQQKETYAKDNNYRKDYRSGSSENQRKSAQASMTLKTNSNVAK